MASNVGSSGGSKHLHRVALVAFFVLAAGVTASACAGGDTVNEGTSSGSGGMGGAGGMGGGGGEATSSSSSASSSSSSSSSSSGTMCTPTTEICDGKDNDCDDIVDNLADGATCECINDETQSCYSGAEGTAGTGMCVAGTQTCKDGKWGACEGEVVPQTEKCDQLDNDCDGTPDNSLDCTCLEGETQACYTGPADTLNVGTCKSGTQTCNAATGMWGACVGDVVPQYSMTNPPYEPKCDGIDENCDGVKDDGNPGGGAACAAAAMGECAKGTQQCINGQIKCTPGTAMPEKCDGLDNNCEGNTDEGIVDVGKQCSTGLSGVCSTGIYECNAKEPLDCKPSVMPNQLTEACNGLDDNCDGMVDNGIGLVGQACTKMGAVGICQFGTYTCPSGVPSPQLTCDAPLPGTVAEKCNGKDDDCDNQIDEDLNNKACSTGLPGVCSAGTTLCSSTTPVDPPACIPTITVGSQSEKCDNLDNDCNGMVDDLNPTATCATQLPGATFVSAWACTMGTCQIATCNSGYANIDGAPGNGCECATDQYANQCISAGTVSVPKGGTVNMVGKIETQGGSDWLTFSFVAPSALGLSYAPKIQLANTAGGQYAMDVMHDCTTMATCNDSGTGVNASVWELNYQYTTPGGNPAGSAWIDNNAKIVSVKVRVYRVNNTVPTCDQYTVTATNP